MAHGKFFGGVPENANGTSWNNFLESNFRRPLDVTIRLLLSNARHTVCALKIDNSIEIYGEWIRRDYQKPG